MCVYIPVCVYVRGRGKVVITTVSARLVKKHCENYFFLSQPAYTCSKLTIETLEQSAKYVHVYIYINSRVLLNSFIFRKRSK